MPRTEVLFYQEAPQDVPVLDWLRELRRTDRRGYAKCVARVQRLAEMGHEPDVPKPTSFEMESTSFEQDEAASTIASCTSFTGRRSQSWHAA